MSNVEWVITSTLSSWGIKIRHPLRTILAGHQLRANVQVAAYIFKPYIIYHIFLISCLENIIYHISNIIYHVLYMSEIILYISYIICYILSNIYCIIKIKTHLLYYIVLYYIVFKKYHIYILYYIILNIYIYVLLCIILLLWWWWWTLDHIPMESPR